MLETFTTETFSPHLDDTFRIAEGPDIELVEVTELGPSPPDRRAPFSLVFRGPPEPPLEQRIYRVEHTEIGAFDLFLVPIGPGRYEAVFT